MSLFYQKRRLKANKIRRQICSTRTMLQRIRVLLSLIMIAAISYFGFKFLKLPQWYLDTEKLAKADPSVLKIQGNIITPDYKIIDMIRQTQLPDIQIFRLDTKELEENIAQLQPVKKVYVRRYWFPARLVIAVDERTPAFLLAPNLDSEPNSALSTDGVLIGHDYLPFKASIKAKKLLTYGVRNGVDEVWDKKRVEEILKLIKAIETYSGQEVQYIDLRNEKDVYIMLEKYLIRFGQINDTALKRAKLIASVLPGAAQYGDRLKYIDLRWEESSYFRLEGVKEKDINKETTAASTETQQNTPKNTEVEEIEPQQVQRAAKQKIEEEPSEPEIQIKTVPQKNEEEKDNSEILN